MKFDNHSASCLKNCTNFLTSLDGPEICNFLQDVYLVCSSFKVAMGLCTKPVCAQSCSIQDWCYFGSLVVLNCPVGYSDWEWKGSTKYSNRLYLECQNSTEKNINKKKTTDNQNNTTEVIVTPLDYSTSTKAVIVGTSTMHVCAHFCTYSCNKMYECIYVYI